ncbi:hypothetical protein IJ425_01345 [bacterium]|nr:hypothetical protein [bacterium]
MKNYFKIFPVLLFVLIINSQQAISTEETTKFQQYIQESAKPPVYSYNYMPYVTFNMPRYSARYAPRYTFGHHYQMFMMNDFYINHQNNYKNKYNSDLFEKDTYTSPNEYKIID